MKLREFGKRILCFLLLLSLLAGLLPTVPVARAEGETQEESSLKGDFAALAPLVPVNEYVHLPEVATQESDGIYRFPGMTGKYFVINKIPDPTGSAPDRYFVMDFTTPAVYGKVAATEVTLSGVGSDGSMMGTRILGMDPGMALSLEPNNEVEGDTRHNIRPLGPYEASTVPYYIYPRRVDSTGTASNTGTFFDLYVTDQKTIASGAALRLELHFDDRMGICVKVPTTESENWMHLGLDTYEYDADTVNYQWHEKTETNTLYNVYFADCPYKVSSYLYRLVTERVNVENLYSAMWEAYELLNNDSRYDPEQYSLFKTCFREAMELYTANNGLTLTTEEAAQQKQAVVDAKEMALRQLISILRINASVEEGSQGKRLHYVTGSMYDWNDKNVNLEVQKVNPVVDEDQGFYFHGTKNVVTTQIYNTWAGKGYQESFPIFNYDTSYDTYIQQYSIYSGLAASDLKDSSNPPFADHVRTMPNFWAEESVEDLVDVYNGVEIPFVYDPATGYYELNSDENGVFFPEGPADGARLSISDLPTLSYVSTQGKPDTMGKDVITSQRRTYAVTDQYCTGFQPFAQMQYKKFRGYSSNVALLREAPSLVEGYLLGGMAQIADANEKELYTDHRLGRMVWTFGMQLAVDFFMTGDGRVNLPGSNTSQDVVFEFSGDDDVWVYIDDKLVLDIGGIHGELEGAINFATGEVTVTSDKYERIRDFNPNGYTQNPPEGHSYVLSEVDETLGSGMGYGSIIDTDGTGKGVMYQRNLYTEVFGESLQQFSESGTHTLRVFYMDRGKGKTNCMIKFNLPQYDELRVKKEIPETYAGSDKKLSEETLSYLNTKDFTFVLTKNGVPQPNMAYYVMDGDTRISEGHTGKGGEFVLKNGQTAGFYALDFRGGDSYRVIETLPDQWWTTSWIATAEEPSTGEGLHSPVISVDGDPYASELITFLCRNSYSYDPVLTPEEQVVVMDYGKPIDIHVIDNAVFDGISELVAREGRVTAVTVDSADASYGSARLLDDRRVRFTLNKLLDRPVHLSCDVELTLDDQTLRQTAISVTVLPATIMYYETDFASGVFKTESQNPPAAENEWTTATEAVGYDEVQDRGENGDTVYDMVIDKEVIPSNAFFVDFDGEGWDDRYAVDPQYNHCDFDTAEAWGVSNAQVSSKSASATAGTMTLVCRSDNGAYPYVQTIIPGTNGTNSKPLKYMPDKDDYLQIRLRIDNCNLTEYDPIMTVFLKKNYETNPGNDVDKGSNEYYDIDLKKEGLKSGSYITIRKPIGELGNFSTADVINAFRFGFYPIHPEGSENVSIVFDYIYIGPEIGMAETGSTRDYLYFGFDNDPGAPLRYSSSIYGGYNFDSGDYWATAYSPYSVKDATVIPGEGTLTVPFKDEITIESDGTQYHRLDVETTNTPGCYPWLANSQYFPLHYTPGKQDQVQIRLKLTGCADGGAEYISSNGSGNGAPSLVVVFDYETANGDQLVAECSTLIDLSVTDYFLVNLSVPDVITPDCVVRSLDLRFFHIKSATQGSGSVTVDYIYVGPEETLPHAQTGQVARNEEALFFDFTDTDTDKLRYSSSIYGGTNYDQVSPLQWNGNAYTRSVSLSGGNLVAELGTNLDYGHGQDQDEGWYALYLGDIYNDRAKYLDYTPGQQDYCTVRFKISNAKSTQSNGYSRVTLYYFPDGLASFTQEGKPEKYNEDLTEFKLEEALDQYLTVSFPMDSMNYREAKKINGLALSFAKINSLDGINPATVSVDYLYIGPMVEANPAAQSLYFSFENTPADRWRYDDDTYGYLNYDVGNWNYNPDRDDTPEFRNNEGVLLTHSKSNLNWYHTALLKKTDNPLNYHPSNGEIIQIRFRALNKTATRNSTVRIMYFEDNTTLQNPPTAAKAYVDHEAVNRGEYVTLTMETCEAFRNANSVTGIRITFWDFVADEGDFIIDYLYIGPDDRPDQIYGYDSHYENDETLSDGDSLFVHGSGVKLNESTETYTEASFDFMGTGFDIISRTGVEQATIRVEVKRKGAPASEDPVKTLTVNNKGELELYQIPVVSIEGLPYGEYTVTLWVNKAVSTGISFLDRGGQFYLDAVRIYEPMGTDYDVNALFAEAYKSDKEAYPHIKEIRNILLSADNFAQLVTAGEGAIFVDAHNAPEATVPATDADGETTNETVTVTPPGIQISEHYVADVQTYNKVGPKNEVYLAPKQAVAFRLDISTSYMPTSVDVGVKNIAPGETGKFAVGVVSKTSTATDLQITYRREIPVGSATSQYYALELSSDALFTETVEGKPYRYCYIVLYNDSTANITHEDGTGEGKHVLSVTDMKLAYAQTPEVGLPKDQITDPEIEDIPEKRNVEPYFDFKVDDRTLEAAALFMKAVLETPVLVEDTDLMHSLNLASDIALNYAIRKEKLADFDSFCLECVIPVYRDGIPVAEEKVSIDPVEKDGLYYFTLEGLTAVQMNDVIHATLRMEKAGRSYYSETDRYSIAQYAYTQLGKTGISPQLQTLCAELLRYGSAAQSFKGYRTDALADGAMTEEQRALLSDLTEVSFGSHNRELGELSEPTIGWKGKALLLDSKVTLRYVIDTTGYTGRIQDLSLRVSYEDHSGEEKTVLLTDPKAYGNGAGLYSFDFDSLLAAELRTVLYAAVYAGDTRLSDTLEYSVDTYGNNKTGTLGTLCRALMAYSDSAKAFFTK